MYVDFLMLAIIIYYYLRIALMLTLLTHHVTNRVKQIWHMTFGEHCNVESDSCGFLFNATL